MHIITGGADELGGGGGGGGKTIILMHCYHCQGGSKVTNSSSHFGYQPSANLQHFTTGK